MSNQLQVQNIIRLENINFPVLELASSNLIISESILDNVNMNLSFDVLFTEENNSTFIVRFNLELNSEEEKQSFKAKVSMSAVFSTEKPMEEDFRNSDFIQINAPAIAFPYLRSFVTNITTQAGYKPLILPIITLTLMKKDKSND